MIAGLRQLSARRDFTSLALVSSVLALAAILGATASLRWLVLLTGLVALVILLLRPQAGLPLLIIVCLVGPVSFATGTDVRLNPASLLTPALLGLWALTLLIQPNRPFATSRVFAPLGLFLVELFLALLIGMATWSPNVPRAGNFTLVQLAQWALFVFCAGAMWLGANLNRTIRAWRISYWTFLIIGGALALLTILPGPGTLVARISALALTRSPFWVLLAGLAAGQLLFNRQLPPIARAWLALALLSTLVFAFIAQRESISTWLGVAVTLAALVWQRFRRLRWLAVGGLVLLLALGLLFPAVYNFAGGDQEARSSGESRVVLSQRVIEETMRNPLTGLGPAAYRPYAKVRPLPFYNAYWLDPQVSAHNNYVDLFAHGGIIALALFFWFVVEFARLGVRLRPHYPDGFAGGLLAGVLAVGAGCLVIMALADWILPFVYNIGFDGFPAAVLVWLFAGSLVTLEHLARSAPRGV